MNELLLQRPVEAFGHTVGLKLGFEGEALVDAPERDSLQEAVVTPQFFCSSHQKPALFSRARRNPWREVEQCQKSIIRANSPVIQHSH